MRSFTSFSMTNGKIADLDRNYPSYLSAWNKFIETKEDDTHYGYVFEGVSKLYYQGKSYNLYSGDYFSVPGKSEIIGGSGVLVSREEFSGSFVIGSSEKEGRLAYIDGCKDSVLIHPIIMGDPCLNMLYFPPGIYQTKHTHPSDRIGMIVSGNGICHSEDDYGEQIETELSPGVIFCIHANGNHFFSTGDSHMTVLAYHPESDFGATNDNHPMINRTIVNGISASKIDSIKTKWNQNV